MANEKFLRVLRELNIDIVELWQLINEMAGENLEKKRIQSGTKSDRKEEYVQAHKNARGSGRGIYNTQGISQATLYNIANSPCSVSRHKASLILHALERRYKRLYRNRPEKVYNYEDIDITLYERRNVKVENNEP